MAHGNLRHSIVGTPQGGLVSPLLANISLHEMDRDMDRDTMPKKYEREKRQRRGLANFLSIRYADDFVVLCDGRRGQAEALRQELYEFLRGELKLALSIGLVFLGYLIDRHMVGTGKWAPRIRIPTKAVEKVRDKIRAALAPKTHKDSVRAKILGLNRIIGGWCRDYQMTSSPSVYFGKLAKERFW